MSPTAPVVAVGVALLAAAAIACVHLAMSPRVPSPHAASSGAASPRAASPGAASRSSTHEPPSTERIVAAVTVGVLVLLATRLVMVALAASMGVLWWRRLLRDERSSTDRRRLEGIASWLEDLRDALRGSSMGAEEAMEHVALRAPESVREPLEHYVVRRRQGLRVDEALDLLAVELQHPTGEAAVAALRLAVDGTTGAARLHPTVGALAAAARDEVRARERIDRTRAVYRASMKRLIVIAVALVAYLRFGAGDLLDPYESVAGQVFIAVPIAMWLGCVLWLRNLCEQGAMVRA